MTDTLTPAATLAAEMKRPAAGGSEAYQAARTALLVQEIELRRAMERVAAERRALPRGPKVREDYVFQGQDAGGERQEVRLSELFLEGTDSLVIYAYMFPRHAGDTREPAASGVTARLPLTEQPCPSCTGLIDQLDAAAQHFEAGGGNIAIVAGTALENLVGVGRDRGWRHLRLLSAAGNSFRQDYAAVDEDGQSAPMTLVFKRDADGTIRLFWASDMVWADSDPGQDHRAAATIEPFWNMFDLTPGGRPDFHEQLQYPCCAGHPASGEGARG